jgi:plastocyanin
MNTHRVASLCLVVSLGLIGSTTSAGPAVAQQVVIEGVKFVPEITVVKSGQWVQWVNKDPFPHTVTSAGKFDSHSIPAGGTWKHRMREVGDFEYICTLHSNMKAILRVEK